MDDRVKRRHPQDGGLRLGERNQHRTSMCPRGAAIHHVETRIAKRGGTATISYGKDSSNGFAHFLGAVISFPVRAGVLH